MSAISYAPGAVHEYKDTLYFRGQQPLRDEKRARGARPKPDGKPSLRRYDLFAFDTVSGAFSKIITIATRDPRFLVAGPYAVVNGENAARLLDLRSGRVLATELPGRVLSIQATPNAEFVGITGQDPRDEQAFALVLRTRDNMPVAREGHRGLSLMPWGMEISTRYAVVLDIHGNGDRSLTFLPLSGEPGRQTYFAFFENEANPISVARADTLAYLVLQQGQQLQFFELGPVPVPAPSAALPQAQASEQMRESAESSAVQAADAGEQPHPTG
jgi:hypothetical protein